MPPAVQITRGLGANSEFIRQVRKQTARKTEERMRQVALDAERRADEIVSKEYVNDRATERRRPGPHLLGSFHAEVQWNGQDFPVAVTLRSSAPKAKVNSLNFGSKPHTIKGNPKLAFPTGNEGRIQAYGTQRPGKRTKKGKGVASAVVPQVQHPGTGAGYFLQRALEGAVQAAYAQAVKLRR